MEKGLGDEQNAEVAYVLEEDADEIIDINDDDVVNALNQDYDEDDDDCHIDSAADMATEDMDAMNLAGSSNSDCVTPTVTDSVSRNDALVTFSSHTGSVFCTSISSRKLFAVTGGEDDVAYVWNVTNGATVLKCAGHKDSVTCVGFNHDSTLVVTGDMAGMIRVWSVYSLQEVWSYEVDDLEWLRWHRSSNVLLAGTKSGDVWMWLVPTTSCKTFAGHGVRCTVGETLHDGRRVCVGYEDGTVKLVDLKSGATVHTLAAGKLGHDGEVTCMDCHSSDGLIITGSIDVTALFINVNTGKVVHKLVCAEQSRQQTAGNDDIDDDDDGGSAVSDTDSVEAVGFSPSCGYVATATHFGVLTVWETGSFNIRHRCKHDTGVIRLRWDLHRPVVYTCTEAGSVHSWDARSGSLLRTWLGHSGNILDMDISSEWIVTAGDDHTARTFILTHSASAAEHPME